MDLRCAHHIWDSRKVILSITSASHIQATLHETIQRRDVYPLDTSIFAPMPRHNVMANISPEWRDVQYGVDGQKKEI
jgi:hypothetical protein